MSEKADVSAPSSGVKADRQTFVRNKRKKWGRSGYNVSNVAQIPNSSVYNVSNMSPSSALLGAG